MSAPLRLEEGPGRLEKAGRASWSLLGLAFVAMLAVYLFTRYSGLLVPSAIGIVLAATLSPLVALLSRWHVPRIVGTLVVSLVIIGALIFLTWQFVVIVVNDSPHIFALLRSGAADLDKWLGQSPGAKTTVERLQSMIGTLEHAAASGLVPLAFEGARAAYSLIVALFLAGGFTFFFLWEGPLARSWISAHMFLPAEVGNRVTASLVHTTRMYILGVSCIGLLQAIIVGGTAVAVGVVNWPVIAFAIFLGNYIPYVGGIVTGFFAVLLTLGAAGPKAALAVLIALLVSFVFVGPHIGVFFIGGALKMPVAAVFAATMVGATLVGFFGAAAAAPLVRLVMDARHIIRESREQVDGAPAGGDPPGADAAPGEPTAPNDPAPSGATAD